ncbi:hypothetical protein ACLKA6_017323 [Drosophila palustris]
MDNYTEMYLDGSDGEKTPSELNDDRENMPLSDYLGPNRNSRKNENNGEIDMLKKILSNTVEIMQSLKGLTSRIEKLEEDNKKMHCRQLTELSMTQKLIKPKKESPILKSPCNSVEEFKKLEDNLMKSPELNEKLEDEIFKHEGTDPSKFVRSMWRKILSDNVASQYSWKGTAKKKAIDIMAVTNAFRGAYNRKFLGSDKEFGRATVKWFQTAKERHSKKKK